MQITLKIGYRKRSFWQFYLQFKLGIGRRQWYVEMKGKMGRAVDCPHKQYDA